MMMYVNIAMPFSRFGGRCRSSLLSVSSAVLKKKHHQRRQKFLSFRSLFFQPASVRIFSSSSHQPSSPKQVQLVASGDSRLIPNQVGWSAQQQLETNLEHALKEIGVDEIIRVHPYDPIEKHGFITSQAHGIQVFRNVNPTIPIIVATAVWQYSTNVLPGLSKHQAPILTAANWSGQWPGLVGMLNLNGSLTKAGIKYSTIWSIDFQKDDKFARQGLQSWLSTGTIDYDFSHVQPLATIEQWPPQPLNKNYDDDGDFDVDVERGTRLAQNLRNDQAIMGVFDEGCMGMFNAIIPDSLLQPMGVFKERLSQADLYAEMLKVSDETAQRHYQWLLDHGMTFVLGNKEATELTESQILEGLKMYDAAVRLSFQHGCSAIGIQYQHGLQQLCVSSDLAEGLLNNPERPPVFNEQGKELMPGCPIVHFNEVDECAGLDGIITNKIWTEMGLDPATTLHDLRWGEDFMVDTNTDRGKQKQFVWVFEISGAVPPHHLVGGYAGAVGERQPSMYFRRGGSTIKGISHPGEIVWSRIYVSSNELCMDLGRGCAIILPEEESLRRWEATTPNWPMMHAILYGVSRNQLMAKHQANHIQVVYAPNDLLARKALIAKAAMAQELGIKVNLCGDYMEGCMDQYQKMPPR